MTRKLLGALVLAGFVGIMLQGCGGSAPEPEPMADTGPCPSWFSMPPEDPDFLYAPATATSRDLQTAMDKAKLSGRAQLAAQVETHIEGLQTRFNEEIGLAEESKILDKFSQAMRGVIDQTLRGSRAKESSSKKEGSVWRACVLMEVPVATADGNVVDAISKDEEMYTRFRESQMFQQLEYQLQQKREREGR